MQVQQWRVETTDEIHLYSLFDSLQLSRTEGVAVEVAVASKQENHQGMFHLTRSTIIEPILRQKAQQLSLMIRILKFRISPLSFDEIYSISMIGKRRRRSCSTSYRLESFVYHNAPSKRAKVGSQMNPVGIIRLHRQQSLKITTWERQMEWPHGRVVGVFSWL